MDGFVKVGYASFTVSAIKSKSLEELVVEFPDQREDVLTALAEKLELPKKVKAKKTEESK